MKFLSIERFGLHLLFTFLSSFAVTAQTAPPAATPTPKVAATPVISEEDQVVKVESRLVVVPVSVTDTKGEPIVGLTAKDFRIAEEGRPQVVENVGNAESVPLEIALLFDVSATTSPMFKFQQETAAKFLRDVLRPADRATIYTVGDSPILVHPRDTAEASIAAIQTIIPTKQSTAFFDSVSTAAEYLRKNAPAGTRRVVVVISDGEDTNSARIANAIQSGYARAGESINKLDNKTLYELTVKNRNDASIKERSRVGKSLQDADTVFYAINPAGSSYQLNKISVYGQENMQLFADQTGGTAFLPKFAPIDSKDALQNEGNMRKNQTVLETIFRQLASELRAQYLVQYYSDAEFPSSKFVKLDVALQNPMNYRVRARRGYYPKN